MRAGKPPSHMPPRHAMAHGMGTCHGHMPVVTPPWSRLRDYGWQVRIRTTSYFLLGSLQSVLIRISTEDGPTHRPQRIYPPSGRCCTTPSGEQGDQSRTKVTADTHAAEAHVNCVTPPVGTRRQADAQRCVKACGSVESRLKVRQGLAYRAGFMPQPVTGPKVQTARSRLEQSRLEQPSLEQSSLEQSVESGGQPWPKHQPTLARTHRRLLHTCSARVYRVRQYHALRVMTA